MNFIGALTHDYLSVKLAVILAVMFQQMEGCFSFPFKLLVSLRTYLWSRSCEFSTVDGIRKIGVSLEYLFAEILSTVINSVFYTLG